MRHWRSLAALPACATGGLLESALDRPKNRHAYSPDATIFDLAAALCVGVSKNHAFVDGNKRTALLAANAFLFLNGWNFDPEQREEVETMVGVAAGEITEERLATWLEANSRPA
jgi:death-on-curing protein